MDWHHAISLRFIHTWFKNAMTDAPNVARRDADEAMPLNMAWLNVHPPTDINVFNPGFVVFMELKRM
jgi:hypothetical protein